MDQLKSNIAVKDDAVFRYLDSLDELPIIGHLSLFELALQHNWPELIQYLSEHEQGREQTVLMDKGIATSCKYMAGETDDVLDLEKMITNSFGDQSMNRTPLILAARYGNIEAVEALLKQGVSVKDKDVLGYTALDYIALLHSDDLLSQFIELCKNYKCKLDLSERFLYEKLGNENIWQWAKQCKLPIKSKRILFSFAIASLQVDRVAELLKDKYDVNKMVTYENNPIDELAFSTMVKHCLPKSHELAGLAVMKEFEGGGAIHIDNDLIANLGDGEDALAELDNLFKAASEEAMARPAKHKLSETEQDKLRLDILNLLLDAGLDVEIYRSKYAYDIEEEILKHRSQALSKAMADAGLLGPEHISSDTGNNIFTSDIFWELPAESILQAKLNPEKPEAGQETEVWLCFTNGYGVVNQLSMDCTIQEGERFKLEKVEEWIDYEGERFTAKELKEPIYDEHLYTAVFKASFTPDSEINQITLHIHSEIEDLNLELSDWL